MVDLGRAVFSYQMIFIFNGKLNPIRDENF